MVRFLYPCCFTVSNKQFCWMDVSLGKGHTRFSPSAGTPQIWLLDIFLCQVLSILFAWYLSQVGVRQMLYYFFAWYLCQVFSCYWARSEWARYGIFFLLDIWASSEWARCSFLFLLGILCQIRGATADGEKRVVLQTMDKSDKICLFLLPELINYTEKLTKWIKKR